MHLSFNVNRHNLCRQYKTMIQRKHIRHIFLFFALFLVTSCQSASIKCSACKVVAKKIYKYAENKTSLNSTITALQEACNSKFQKHNVEKKICDFIVKGMVKVFPLAIKEFNSLAWDSSNLCNIAGACKVKCCLTKLTPEQVHISLTKDLSEMAVMWTTLEDTKLHQVQYGLDENILNFTSTGGFSTSYDHFGWQGNFHVCKMKNLHPATRYFYRVGDGTHWSKIYSFKTFHVDIGNSNLHPLRIGSIGDMGYASNSDNTINSLSKLIDNDELDMIIHNGDISYADGEFEHWDVFMRKVEKIASRVPYQVTPGNHEMWFNFSAYINRFYMPDERSHQNLYYSFQVSNIQFIAMDTETWYDRARISKTQAKWIENELVTAAANDVNKLRWKIAYGHRPLYCSNHGGQDIPHGNKVLRDAIEDVLYTNKVDLVIQAHEHDYERSLPVYKTNVQSMNYTNCPAPVYVVNGAAGNREKNSKPPGGPSYWPKGLNRTNFVSFGYIKINPNNVTWKQILSANEEILDQFVIVKE